MMQIFSNIPPLILLVFGSFIGFLFSIFILNIMYKESYKKYTIELTNQFNEINQRLIDKIHRLENQK